MGNKKFALKCDFSRLTPRWDFQLISLNIPSWRFLASRLKSQHKPPEVEKWKLPMLQPRAGVQCWSCPTPGRPMGNVQWVCCTSCFQFYSMFLHLPELNWSGSSSGEPLGARTRAKPPGWQGWEGMGVTVPPPGSASPAWSCTERC